MNFHVKKCDQFLDEIKDESLVLLTAGKQVKKSADAAYPFCVNRNFYYLTGIDEPDVILFLVKTKGLIKKILFIKKADPIMEKWVGKTIHADEARTLSGIEHVELLDMLETFIYTNVNEYGLKNLYIDDEGDETIHFGKNLIKKHPKLKDLTEHNAYPIIAKLRSVKEPEEIELIKKAIAITEEGILNMADYMCGGMKENEMEAYFDFALKLHQSVPAFETIAAGGARGTILHYVANNQPVKDQELVLFDLGAAVKNYCADISRTLPVSGKFTERQKTLYNIVLKAHDNVIQAVKPGVTMAELQDITVKTYQEELRKIGLIQEGTVEEVRRYYYHGVSHSLGLDTHDVGIDRNEKLKPGCVFTVEPGLYIEEEAIGIRIEDDVVVTETGCEVLSAGIMRTVEEIEDYFSQREND